jgi:hypothetical protein
MSEASTFIQLQTFLLKNHFILPPPAVDSSSDGNPNFSSGNLASFPMVCVRKSLGIALHMLVRGGKKNIKISTENRTQDINSTASGMFQLDV